MSLLYTILLGALVGWLAGKLSKGSGFGAAGNILVGIVGGAIGGFLFDVIGLVEDGSLIGSLVTGVVGALVLLFLVGKFTK
ncbi:MAG: GlsB/YeaQ/YmgE family stress response membrane protein [Planctomycetota bacterium]|jgi:uncharacterized membrane protein YeaQ/YmgE (transglycosylase-associated protein family)